MLTERRRCEVFVRFGSVKSSVRVERVSLLLGFSLLPCVSAADEAQGSFTSHLHFELI